MEKKRQVVLLVSIIMLVAAIVMLVTLAVISSLRNSNENANKDMNAHISEVIDKNNAAIKELKNGNTTDTKALADKITNAVKAVIQENTGSSTVDVKVDEDELSSKISLAVEKALSEASSSVVKTISAEDIQGAIEAGVKTSVQIPYDQFDRIVKNAVSRLTYNIAKKSEVKEVSDEIRALSERLKEALNASKEPESMTE